MSPLLLAVGLVAGGALALEVLLTRILAIIHWHHFAGMVISLALLGYGASGSALTPLLDRLRPQAPLAFAAAATLFGLTAVVSVAVAQVVPFNALELIWTVRQWLWLAVLYLLFAVPFFFAAACTGLALACLPAPVDASTASTCSAPASARWRRSGCSASFAPTARCHWWPPPDRSRPRSCWPAHTVGLPAPR